MSLTLEIGAVATCAGGNHLHVPVTITYADQKPRLVEVTIDKDSMSKSLTLEEIETYVAVSLRILGKEATGREAEALASKMLGISEAKMDMTLTREPVDVLVEEIVK